MIRRAPAQDGFTLLEAMVALAIVAMVVIAYLGIRTSALVDATEARNWRLAREIAEEKLSELIAGARELPPESGTPVQLDDKYKGFRYTILIGEAAVSQVGADLASEDGSDRIGTERAQWQQDRDVYRRANQKGMDYLAYQDQLRQQEEERQRQEQPPSETDFEQVAVVVHFPRTRLDQEGDDAFVLKAKVSTLALSGLTTEQAEIVARSRGQEATAGNQPPTAGGTGSGTGAGALGAEGGKQ
jgi:prepilin-type N-terminal cleavage/methylation domain-containing protein